jgi:hypothetical protein
LDGCDILHVLCSVSSNDGHTFVVVEEDVHMAPQRLCWAPQNLVGVWLCHSPMLALVHHRSNSVAPEFLQILLCTSFLGRGRTFSYNPSSFIFFFAGTSSPSSNRSSFPSR